MKTRILFLLVTLLTIVQGAWAQSYITDVMVVGADDDDEAEAYYDYYTSQGWSGIWKDLNNNAGGHYIYLMYKTNTSPGSSGRAITDFFLHVSANYDAPNSLEYDGRTYSLAGYDGDGTFKEKRGDLNCEAGGYWIHLFYTKDRYWPLTYVTGISIDGNSENAVCENTRDTPCDLNKDAGGSDIFMHVSKYTETWDEHRSSEFSHVNGNTIYIENEGELALLAHEVTSNGNTYLGKTVVLNRDLDLSEYKWNPIGYWAGNVHQFHGEPNYDPGSWRDFRGDFDGKGHTIKGLYASGNDLPSGLFGYIVGETLDGFRTVRGCNYIKNLNIVDAYINGNSHVGGLAGYVYGEFKIDNVVVQGSFTSRKYVGGIVGYGRAYHPNVEGIWLTMTIKDCVYLGPNLSGSYGSGAIYGYLEDTSETQQCKNYYANLGWPNNSNVWRLAAVRHKSLPEGIKLSLQANNCYWYDGVPYCKSGAEVSYTASSNTFYYDLTGTTLDGENKGLKHSFNVAEGTDYTIDVKCDATGITGNGSKADPYLLTTDKQWSQLLHMHSQGRSFNGLHFKLGADINISAAMPDSPAGFDGDGHTMTVNLKATGIYYGPLHSVRNATIKNLHVAGTLTTDQLYSGGLVGRVYGNTSFTNCRSSVSILSSIAGSGNHGGFVGTVMDEDANVSIDGCRFDGKILSVGDAPTNSCSGFVGEKRAGANLTISNSLYTPAELADGEVEAADFSATLARYTDGVAPSFVNAGYSRPLGAVQGVSATDTKPEGMGDVVNTYDVSGITRYDAGVEHDGWWYMNVHVVELADNAPNSSLISEAADQYSGQAVNATIQGRTFYADGNWNTICLPFDVTLESSPLAGAEARTLSSAALNNGTLTLNFSDPVETLTAGTPYIIKWVPTSSNTHLVIWTAKDWDAFAASVNGGKDYDRMTVELGADITVTSMVGTREHPFKGTFNGNGHTLTVNLTSNDQCCAPFRGIAGATIKNLHTAGTVTANAAFASGLVGMNNGVSAISNCRSSVHIVSNDGYMNGGLLGASSNRITYTNCLFDGSFTNNSFSTMFACFTGVPLLDFGKYYNCLSKLKSATGNNITLFPFGTTTLTGVPVTNCYYSDEFTYKGTYGSPIGDMTNEQLATALGDGWQVKDGEVIPVVKNTPTSGNVVNPVFYGAYITAAEPVDITPGLTVGTDGDGSITFKGIYDPMEIGDGGDNTKLYFSSNNTLYWPIGAMTFKPFRAYFQLNTTASVRAYSLHFSDGDETTGIVSMEDGRGQMEDVWYDLNGRKLNGKPTQKGVYIYKGKKAVVK